VFSRDQVRRDFPDFLYPSEDQPEPLLERFLLVDGGGLLVSPSLSVVTSLVRESLLELRLRWRDFERDFLERLRDVFDELRLRLRLRLLV